MAQLRQWVLSPHAPHFPDYITDVLSNMAVDLGGSLAVASRGLYSTGVSTDLNGKEQQGCVAVYIVCRDA